MLSHPYWSRIRDPIPPANKVLKAIQETKSKKKKKLTLICLCVISRLQVCTAYPRLLPLFIMLIKSALSPSATRWEQRLANDGKKTPATPNKILWIHAISMSSNLPNANARIWALCSPCPQPHPPVKQELKVLMCTKTWLQPTGSRIRRMVDSQLSNPLTNHLLLLIAALLWLFLSTISWVLIWNKCNCPRLQTSTTRFSSIWKQSKEKVFRSMSGFPFKTMWTTKCLQVAFNFTINYLNKKCSFVPICLIMLKVKICFTENADSKMLDFAFLFRSVVFLPTVFRHYHYHAFLGALEGAFSEYKVD